MAQKEDGLIPRAGLHMTRLKAVGIVNTSENAIVGSHIQVASTAWSRLVGLLGKVGLAPGGGIFIVPSSGVHTWGMQFVIDVVALDRDMRVLGVWEQVGGFRIVALRWKTHSVLELPAGAIRRSRIKVNDQLAIVPADQHCEGFQPSA